MRGARPALALLAAAAVPVAAGCGDETPAGTASERTVTAAPAGATVFFMNEDATALVRSVRRVADTGVPVRNAMEALAQGPDRGTLPALPPGTRVLGVSVEDGLATVDFDAAFAAGYPSGGAAAELAVVAPIVFTATAAPGVRRVRILVDGGTPVLAGTQFDWSRPFTRGDLPALRVAS